MLPCASQLLGGEHPHNRAAIHSLVIVVGGPCFPRPELQVRSGAIFDGDTKKQSRECSTLGVAQESGRLRGEPGESFVFVKKMNTAVVCPQQARRIA